MADPFNQLEVGQKEKEVDINQNFSKVYLGEFANDATANGENPFQGSMYFNTTSSKLRILGTDSVWRNAA